MSIMDTIERGYEILIADLGAQLHKLSGEHCGLKNAYQEEKTNREYLEAENKRLNESYSELSKSIRAEVDCANEQYAILEAQVDILRKSIAELLDQNTALWNNEADYQAEAQELKAENAKLKSCDCKPHPHKLSCESRRMV